MLGARKGSFVFDNMLSLAAAVVAAQKGVSEAVWRLKTSIVLQQHLQKKKKKAAVSKPRAYFAWVQAQVKCWQSQLMDEIDP